MNATHNHNVNSYLRTANNKIPIHRMVVKDADQRLAGETLGKVTGHAKPRPPMSAFGVFVQYEKPLLEEKLRNEGESLEPNDPGVVDILKDQWMDMDSWQKNVYRQLAQGDRKRYNQELKMWNAHAQSSKGRIGEYLRSVLFKGSTAPANQSFDHGPRSHVPYIVSAPVMLERPNACVSGILKRARYHEEPFSESPNKITRYSYQSTALHEYQVTTNTDTGASAFPDWDAIMNSQTSFVADSFGLTFSKR